VPLFRVALLPVLSVPLLLVARRSSHGYCVLLPIFAFVGTVCGVPVFGWYATVAVQRPPVARLDIARQHAAALDAVTESLVLESDGGT